MNWELFGVAALAIFYLMLLYRVHYLEKTVGMLIVKVFGQLDNDFEQYMEEQISAMVEQALEEWNNERD